MRFSMELRLGDRVCCSRSNEFSTSGELGSRDCQNRCFEDVPKGDVSEGGVSWPGTVIYTASGTWARCRSGMRTFVASLWLGEFRRCSMGLISESGPVELIFAGDDVGLFLFMRRGRTWRR